jgi:formate dehydrogenase major subunit
MSSPKGREGGESELEDRSFRRYQRVVMKNHGCHPFGNAKARSECGIPGRIPLSRAFTTARTRREYPTTTQEGVLAAADPLQVSAGRTRTSAGSIISSGAQSFEGAAEGNGAPWLAELQQDN